MVGSGCLLHFCEREADFCRWGKLDMQVEVSVCIKIKMNIRIQLNSKTDEINVFKNMPSTDDKKRYALKVEQLTVPAMSDGLILNQPLFSVERRLVQDEIWSTVPTNVNAQHIPHVSIGLPAGDWTFTPQNVKTISQLLHQMNHFFRKKVLQAVTSATVWIDDATVNNHPIVLDQNQANDWFGILNTAEGLEGGQTALQAIYRSDGKIAIKFSPAAQQMFVLRMTDEGKRILGWSQRHIAIDDDNDFKEEYVPDTQVASADPAVAYTLNVATTAQANTESIVCVLDNSIFNQGHYRHELVIMTTLPLRNYLECDNRTALYKNQLASYRYPSEPIRTEYQGTLFKVLKEERRNRYLFEQGNRTHNEFLLTSTQLQNFHLRLVSRNYKWDETLAKFVITDIPYSLPDESLWTIQLLVNELA